jgi:hypothetical protein
MFTAAQQLGARPRQMAEKRQEQQMLGGLVPGTPEYSEALAKLQMQRGQLTEAATTGAAAGAQRQAATQAAQETATKSRLIGAALKKARDDNSIENYSSEAARITSMTAEELQQYLTPKERDTTVISAGGVLADTATGEVLARAPFKEQEQKNQVFELVKSGKWDPASISTDENGNIKWNEIEPLDKGDVDTPKNPPEVEREVIRRTKEATQKAVDFNRSRRLRSSILTSGDRSAGLVGDVRTAIFTLAGIRDKEESEKTQYLRRINTDILTTLPPGVASDTDVAIFSKGLPPASAGETEILEYLEVEERLLAAAVDKSRLYEKHIQLQRDAGVTPTTAGIGDFEVRYANTMKIIEGRLQRKEISEQEAKRLFQTYIGFVPTYYQ